MFKIVSNNDPVELEMSVEELNIGLRIAAYINENFAASDFYEIKNTTQRELQAFMSLLQEKKNEAKSEEVKLSFALDKADYFIFRDLFGYADNFLDEEMREDDIDEIIRISEIMSAEI